MEYPVTLTPEDGVFIVDFPDFPTCHSVGDTVEEALKEAQDALETAFEVCFKGKRPVPAPSKIRRGQHAVSPPATVSAKVFLHNELLATGVKKAELARRMGISASNIERLFKLRHKTRFETLEAALACLGRKIDVRLAR